MRCTFFPYQLYCIAVHTFDIWNKRGKKKMIGLSRLLIRCIILCTYLPFHHTQVLLQIWSAFYNMTKNAHENVTRTIFYNNTNASVVSHDILRFTLNKCSNNPNRVTISLIPIAFWADGSPEKTPRKPEKKWLNYGWGGEIDHSLAGPSDRVFCW